MHRDAISAVYSTPPKDITSIADELILTPNPLLRAKSEEAPPPEELEKKQAASSFTPAPTKGTTFVFIIAPPWKTVLREKRIDVLFCVHRDLRGDDYFVFNFLLDKVHATKKREQDDTLLAHVIDRLDYPLTLEWARKQYESKKTRMNKEKAGSWESLVLKWQTDLSEWWSWYL